MTWPTDVCSGSAVEVINQFSNPELEHNNQVTGDDESNCAQTIRETMVKCPESILRVS